MKKALQITGVVIGGEVIAAILVVLALMFVPVIVRELFAVADDFKEWLIATDVASRTVVDGTRMTEAIVLFPFTLVGILLMGVWGTSGLLVSEAFARVAIVKPLAYAIVLMLHRINHENMLEWYASVDRFVTDYNWPDQAGLVMRAFGVGEYVTSIGAMLVIFAFVHFLHVLSSSLFLRAGKKPRSAISWLMSGLIVVAITVFFVLSQ